MAGLMPRGGAPAPRAPAPRPQPAAAPAPQDDSWLAEEEEAASPEEQDLYEQVVASAWTIVYNKQFFEKVRATLTVGQPVDQLAKVAAMVVFKVVQDFTKRGQDIPGDVLLHAGKEIYEDLAELSTKLGAFDFTADQKAFEAGWLKALDEFRLLQEQSGTLDKEAAQAEFQQLQQADQDGRLEQKMQSLVDKSANGGRPPAPAEGLAPKGRA